MTGPHLTQVQGKTVEILTQLLDDNREELVFWRARNWSALRTAVGVMGAMASASILKDFPLPIAKAACLCVVILLFASLHTYYQLKNVHNYDLLQQQRGQLLKALGASDPNVFLTGEALFTPPPAKSTFKWLTGSTAFILIGWISALALATMVVVQAVVDPAHPPLTD
jgi:hypothetical protein